MLSKSAEKCQHLLQTVFTGIWQSRGKSVRVNDLDDCSRGRVSPPCAPWLGPEAEAEEEVEVGRYA